MHRRPERPLSSGTCDDHQCCASRPLGVAWAISPSRWHCTVFKILIRSCLVSDCRKSLVDNHDKILNQNTKERLLHKYNNLLWGLEVYQQNVVRSTPAVYRNVITKGHGNIRLKICVLDRWVVQRMRRTRPKVAFLCCTPLKRTDKDNTCERMEKRWIESASGRVPQKSWITCFSKITSRAHCTSRSSRRFRSINLLFAINASIICAC